MIKDIQYYLNLSYQVVLTPLKEEDGGGWLASIPDLKGCMSDGETQQEALSNLLDAKTAWIKTAIKREQKIPFPSTEEDEDYSGKFTLRLPKFLHRELSLVAKKDNMSLNSYLLSLLSLNFGKVVGRNQIKETNNINIFIPSLDLGIKKKYDNSFQKIQPKWPTNITRKEMIN
jgi:Uncharacterized conserved protein